MNWALILIAGFLLILGAVLLPAFNSYGTNMTLNNTHFGNSNLSSTITTYWNFQTILTIGAVLLLFLGVIV